MHIPDGFLAPYMTVPSFVVATPLWILGFKRSFSKATHKKIPIIGVLTAVSFVLQTIMIPIPLGTSTHLIGTSLIAILFNPLVAFVCESIVLILQASLMGTGGFTTLAINALAMGLFGPFLGFIVYRLLSNRFKKVSYFLAGYVSTQAATFLASFVLGLQHYLAPDYFPSPFLLTLSAMMLSSLAVTGIVEGLYNIAVFSVVSGSLDA